MVLSLARSSGYVAIDRRRVSVATPALLAIRPFSHTTLYTSIPSIPTGRESRRIAVAPMVETRGSEQRRATEQTLSQGTTMSEGARDERTQSAGQRGDRAATEPIQNPTYTAPTGDVVALRLQLQLAETQLELERAKKRNAADAELSSRRNSEEEEEAREESRGSPEGSDTRRPAFDAKEYLLIEPPYISLKERAILL